MVSVYRIYSLLILALCSAPALATKKCNDANKALIAPELDKELIAQARVALADADKENGQALSVFLRVDPVGRMKYLVRLEQEDHFRFVHRLASALKEARAVPLPFEAFKQLIPLATNYLEDNALYGLLTYSPNYRNRDASTRKSLEEIDAQDKATILTVLAHQNDPDLKLPDVVLIYVLERTRSARGDDWLPSLKNELIAWAGKQTPQRIKQFQNALRDSNSTFYRGVQKWIVGDPDLRKTFGLDMKFVVRALREDPYSAKNSTAAFLLETLHRQGAISDAQLLSAIRQIAKDAELETVHELLTRLDLMPDWRDHIDWEDDKERSLYARHLGIGVPGKLPPGKTLDRRLKDLSLEIFRDSRFPENALTETDKDRITEMLLHDGLSLQDRDRLIALSIPWGVNDPDIFKSVDHATKVRLLSDSFVPQALDEFDHEDARNLGLSNKDTAHVFLEVFRRIGSEKDTVTYIREFMERKRSIENVVSPYYRDAVLLWSPADYFGSMPTAAALKAELSKVARQGLLPLEPAALDKMLAGVDRASLVEKIARTYALSCPNGCGEGDYRAVVSAGTGILPSALKHSGFQKHDRHAQDFSQLTLDIAERIAGLPFPNLDIAPEVFQSKNFEKLNSIMEQIRTYSEDHDTFMALRKTVGFPERRLEVADLDRMASALQAHARSLVRERYNDLEVELTDEDIVKLSGKLSDFTPVHTLMGRYAADVSWRKELPVLGQVFHHTLAGTFPKYKYEGLGRNTSAIEKQLAPLPKGPRRDAWIGDHSTVAVWNGGKESAALLPESQMRAIRDDVDRLVSHVPEYKPVDKENRRQIISAALADPQAASGLLPGLRAYTEFSDPKSADSVILSAFVDELKNSPSLDHSQKVGLKLVSLFKHNRSLKLPLDVNAAGDLEGIEKFTRDTLTGEGEGIVATMTLSDPIVLLMLGSLTSDRSCLHYRAGEWIHMLPAPVIDADIRALYGTYLTPRAFASMSDYTAVRNAQLQGHSLQSSVRSQDLAVTFTWSEKGRPQTITTGPQSFGHRRELIKLGKTDSGLAGMAEEPPYRTISDAEPMLATQMEKLKAEIAAKAELQRGQAITTAGSTNPSGAHSDTGGSGLGPQRIGVRLRR